MNGIRSGILRVAVLLCLLAPLACTPRFQEVGPRDATPSLDDRFFVTGDGTALPVRRWLPDNPGHDAPPRAVIVALHGYNDYSNAFADSAAVWQRYGIATWAYDQRGFGGHFPRGVWAGAGAMTADLREFVAVLHDRYPGVPVWLLGSSMGGAVAILALASPDPPAVEGVILAAPAIWGREAMPAGYTASLWLAAHTLPWYRASGRNLRRIPSDNREMLVALSGDHSVIRGSRFDALLGLVDLMDRALTVADGVAVPVLYLYGEHDQIIPPGPTVMAIGRIPAARRRVAVYENGWHMLLRDLQADVVRRDIAAWIGAPDAPLPSGADRRDWRHLAD